MTTWISLPGHDHPLAPLYGTSIGKLKAHVLLGPESRVGARYFQVLLTQDATLPETPILAGLHHSGPFPPHNWIEVMTTAFSQHPEVDEPSLFHRLVALIPPGGHLMVEYDSEEREDTRLALGQGAPPILTPLGATLFTAGCDGGFKDWYISEGWSEGPRKLQAYKALDDEMRQRKAEEMARQIVQFVQETPPESDDLWSQCRERAAKLLPKLRKDIGDAALQAEIQRVLSSHTD